ncbi:MAG: BACON domain-containing protein [Alistipes sp.]|nr:BACON domain-containing protein [Alistipes sp.]
MRKVALLLTTICMFAFSCEKLGLGDTNENIFNLSYEVAAEGGVVDVNLDSDLKYKIEIPNDAKSWLSVDDSSSKKNGTIRFIVAENLSFSQRQALVKLVNNEKKKKTLFEITITQLAGGSHDENDVSDFEDCEIDDQHSWK